MWASVWNRVVLLASGMLLGWNLVHYWAAPDERKRGYLLRIILGALLGLPLIIVLAATSAAAAMLGLLVILFCALVAYAANAKQLLKRPWKAPQDPPARPASWTDQRVVYLITALAPERYTGPAVWAEFVRQRAAAGRPTPHWLAFPYDCGRVRRAYAAMDGVSPTVMAVQQLAEAVEAALGENTSVRLASTLDLDALSESLRRSVAAGEREFVLVPLSLSERALTDLRNVVADSRVREAGANIRIANDVEISSWLGDNDVRLDRLWQGEELPAPPEPDAELIDAIISAVDPSAIPVDV